MSGRWSFPPSPLQLWFVRHRTPVRIVGLLLSAAVAVYLIVETALLGRPLVWYAYGQLVIYLGMTINLGWLIPRDIDRWQAARKEGGKAAPSSQE